MIKYLFCLPLVVLLLLTSGCASTKYQFDYVEKSENTVWPLAPEKPRLQYLGAIYGDANLIKVEGSGGFVKRGLDWFGNLLFGDAESRMLFRPQSGAVDEINQKIYVTDAGNKGVFVFDLKDGSLDIWEGIDSKSSFLTPIAVCLLGQNQVFVSDADHGVVTKFDQAGKSLLTFGGEHLSRPTGLACDKKNNQVYIADSQSHSIHVYSADGTHKRTFGRKGFGKGEFNSPTHLSYAHNTLYVSDTLNARIQLFDADGKWLKSFGKRGMFVGNLPRPKGVAVDSEKHIYVIESYYDHLLVFNENGEGLLPVGGNGAAPGQFNLPAGLWIDSQNQIYVADMLNRRISVFKYITHATE